MRRLSLFMAALFFALLCGCAKSGLKSYQAVYLDLFDTVTTVSGYAASRGDFDREAERVYAELLEYHRLCDIYNDYEGLNNVKTLNDAAGGAPVAVDPRLLELLEFASEMYGRSGGAVNVAMGSVLSLWHEAREGGTALPDSAALRAAAEHCGMASLELDREKGTARLADAEMSLDLGAVAKGWAAEQVCRRMEAEGLSGCIVSVGGNVRAVGTKPDGGGWRVGVEDPFLSGGYLDYLEIGGLAAVTSGSYQRFYTVDGVRYHHIIDPETLYPSTRWVSVTIVSESSALADALSTALFNMDENSGAALLKELGAEALWVAPDGAVTYSDGFEKYLARAGGEREG